MKHFAKSFVSIVVALSILATMCIVGVSVSAADAVDTNPNGVTMVSANLEKNASDVVAVGGSTVSVAKTETLTGGTAGVPSADAYVVEGATAGKGIKIPIENSDWSAASAALNPSGFALKGYGVNMWLYISDVSKINGIIMRFYEEAADGTDLWTKNAWTYQVSAVSAIAPKPTFQTGWNNVTFWFPATGDYDHRAGVKANNGGQDGVKMASFQLWEYDSQNTYTMAVACARLVKSADEAAGSWAPAPVVYPTDKEYLVYGLDREEGVTIGDWQDVTYDGGKGAFKTTTSNRVKKYLPKSVDLTGKTVTAWIYVPEGATPAGQFELCTVDQDNGEFTFDSNTFGLKAGWNKVILDPNNKKDTAGVAEGAVGYRANDASSNVADINVVRYYDANADFMLGAVYVTPEVPEVDSNKVGKTIVSANVDKKADDMTASGNATNLSVVKTSELKGGTSGVPSEDAYKFTVGSGTNGLVLPVVNTDWTAVNDSTNADGSAGKDYGVNAWIYVSDASKVSGFIFRFFDGDNNNWNYQVSKVYDSSSTQSYVNGWNNITFWFPNQNRDHDHAVEGGNVAGGDGKTVSRVLVCDYNATGGYDFAIACARLITKSDDANAGWTVGSATGDATDLAVVVVAILLAAMAASVTVYFGKKVR